MQETNTTFVAVQKNEDGDITAFKTSDGRELSYDDALQAVQSGQIADVNVGEARNGRPVIRGNPDGNPDNNLDQLPSF
ncbi:DUF3892 domain-containing protein [Tuberibacillus sp. Marseille-P3662]|uniref:DUF3892 domain-containing protein n=1 Tax=Tuberibacillus sp. Marseille-P3662 TaxID=1965358 RepID=UPI000A1CBD40|nr:DUF3892 domain-containing protein [Tuberibacillus sp. Marseille-P3662]